MTYESSENAANDDAGAERIDDETACEDDGNADNENMKELINITTIVKEINIVETNDEQDTGVTDVADGENADMEKVFQSEIFREELQELVAEQLANSVLSSQQPLLDLLSIRERFGRPDQTVKQSMCCNYFCV